MTATRGPNGKFIRTDGDNTTTGDHAPVKSLPEKQATLEQIVSEANDLARALAVAETALTDARGQHRLGYISQAARDKVERARDKVKTAYDDTVSAQRILTAQVEALEAEAAQQTLETIRNDNEDARQDIITALVPAFVDALNTFSELFSFFDADNADLSDTHDELKENNPNAWGAALSDWQHRKQAIEEARKNAYRTAGQQHDGNMQVLGSYNSSLPDVERLRREYESNNILVAARNEADAAALAAAKEAEEQFRADLRAAGLGSDKIPDSALRSMIGEDALRIVERLIPNSTRSKLAILRRFQRQSVNDGGNYRSGDPRQDASDEKAYAEGKAVLSSLIDG